MSKGVTKEDPFTYPSNQNDIDLITWPLANRKLSDDITGIVIVALHYFDHIDKNGISMTAAETTESVCGGIKRYQIDPVFHAKVTMLVSRLITVIQANEA